MVLKGCWNSTIGMIQFLSDEIAALEKHFDKFRPPVRDAIHLHKPAVLVGSSGTFDTLSEIYCTEQGIPFQAIHPMRHHSASQPSNLFINY